MTLLSKLQRNRRSTDYRLSAFEIIRRVMCTRQLSQGKNYDLIRTQVDGKMKAITELSHNYSRNLSKCEENLKL